MYSKVSVLVPTRGRPEPLQRMLASFEATTDGAAELVFRVDEDDVASQDALAGHRVIVGPQRAGYRSLPMFFNELARAASGDVLMVGNDDMEFLTPHWPGLVLAAANAFEDGLFDLGVRTHNESHYPFSIVSRQVVDRLGFLFDPRVFWGDVFLRDVMGAFGRCVPLPSVSIAHHWMGDEASQNQIYARDPNYWQSTHALAVADAVQRLSMVPA